MEKLNILIVEDTPAESDALIASLTEFNFNVVGVARSHKEAVKLFFETSIDLVVIDIYLNGVPEGITFAETINALPNASKPFVFLTSSSDRATFERARLTRPYSFLLKPFNPLEVIYAIEMAIEKFYSQEDVFQNEEEDTIIGSEFLFIKKKDSLKKVAVSTIINIDVEERYCTIHTESDKFIIQISLSKVVEQLDPSKFLRTHRNHIVNIDHVTEIQTTDNLVALSNKLLIPISNSYKDVFQKFKFLK